MSTTPAPTSAPAPSQNPAAGNGRATNTRQHYRGRRTTTNSFTPKISKIESLASSSENKSQDFSKFQKSLHHHVLTTFKNSKDLSTAILEFADPLVAIRQHTPSLTEIRTRHNLGLQGPTANETEAAKFTRESQNSDSTDTAKIIFSNEIKLVAERERDAVQNLTILWATIIGQCTPALQEEVQGEPDYGARSIVFDSVWLLQTLQKITAGVNKTTNKYFSVFKATKTFYSTQQGFNESLDDYYGRFEAAKT